MSLSGKALSMVIMPMHEAYLGMESSFEKKVRQRCLNLYEARLDSLSIGNAPCLWFSRGRADDMGLRKQSRGRIDGDGLGHRPALLALSGDTPPLVHNQCSCIWFFHSNSQAAKPSDTLLTIRRLVSLDFGLVVVDRH